MADVDVNLPTSRPRRRRKEARPAEIVAVAMSLFVERGFAATRMEEVAGRAGVAKGTVFRYFATKDDLFRAVAASALSSVRDVLEAAAAPEGTPVAILLPELLSRLAHVAGSDGIAIARVVLAEARAFPDLARTWHDEVAGKVLGAIGTLIANGQAEGEVRPGDPRLLAFSILSPLIMGALFGSVFGATGAAVPDLQRLAREHAETLLTGILVHVKTPETRS